MLEARGLIMGYGCLLIVAWSWWLEDIQCRIVD